MEAAKKFVQIIAFETDRIDEMRTLALNTEKRFAGMENGPSYQVVLKDRNQPDRYYEVLEFDSFDEAMRSRENPGAREFAESMAALCTRPPSFIECDIVEASRPK
ncbi:hypothetical protein OIB37_02025 [Streptomyces sp. NBC_00820]|uniref:hypothetical protein n=1 Tax=Streptomyces sp. NBC_00820 TaxID=2975842 RepID=UPI002ED0580D|nr:hypothetical protein OIB37_02025 [Streptomyces sp. NBC_00820]